VSMILQNRLNPLPPTLSRTSESRTRPAEASVAAIH
jgi:hypothetical protein